MKNNIRKSVKRWLALVMTAIMVFAMATTVMAQGESQATGYTITINNGTYNANTKYNLYRIYDATVTDSNGTIGVNYAIATDFEDLASTYGTDASKIDSANLEDLIEDAMGIVISNSPTATYSGMTAGTAIDVLPGYYLIVPVSDAADGGTVTSPCLVSVPGKEEVDSNGSTGDVSKNVEVTPKASETTIDKAITGGDTTTSISTSEDSSTVAIGGEVEYTITSLIPDYGDDVIKSSIVYTITDVADATLNFVSVDSVTMSSSPDPVDLKGGLTGTTNNESNTYYTMTKSDHGFVLTFNYDQLTAGQTITIKATFKLNDTAVISDANNNKVTLEYTNNYYENTTSEIEHDVNTYTFGFGINKIDNTLTAGSQALTGAEFEIYNSSGNLVATIKASGTAGNVIITVYNGTDTTADPADVVYSDEQQDNGSYAIKGLDDGAYTVKETKAPDGYSLASSTQTVTIKAIQDKDGEYDGTYTVNDGNTNTATFGAVTAYAVDINNEKGTTLPGTGGIGTTIFTFGGLALVIIAAIMFIVYTKKQRKQA